MNETHLRQPLVGVELPIALPQSAAAAGRRVSAPSFAALASLFGVFYFVQSLAEPTEGFLAQPVRTLMMGWGHDAAEIAAFTSLLALPWSIKPLYGLLTDFVPLAGYRRKSYLILATALSAGALLSLYFLPVHAGQLGWLFWLLLISAVGVAFADVVVDALMVDHGQPRGITGALQSVQWTAGYAAAALAGLLGGYLSEYGHERLGFAICGSIILGTLTMALLMRERRAPRGTGGAARLRDLREAFRSPALWAVGAFIFLWQFNPFASTVLHVHMVQVLNLSQQCFGQTVAVMALGSMLGSLSYVLLRGRANVRQLLHAAVLLGVVSTAAYWGLRDRNSAFAISGAVGFTSALAVMVQLDLAAQVCPVGVAGTVFAALMSLANFSTLASAWLGGYLYTAWEARWGSGAAFDLLVGLGALFTTACWLVVPRIAREFARLSAQD